MSRRSDPGRVQTILYACLSVVLFMPGVGLSAEPSVLATIQKTNTPMTLMAVQFKDAKAGWAVGSGGTLFSSAETSSRVSPW